MTIKITIESDEDFENCFNKKVELTFHDESTWTQMVEGVLNSLQTLTYRIDVHNIMEMIEKHQEENMYRTLYGKD